ncbi:MAG: hypothetical protein GY928_17065 [Colwellia sp.]|nr:hypothetical protein [Colwellia sp.]
METYTPKWGHNIKGTIEGALKLSKELNDFVSFTFNGITMEVLYPCKLEHYQKVWKVLCEKRQAHYLQNKET